METKTVTRTGVIGLGAMGLQMARHMLSKGFAVTGYDIDVEAMRRAIEQGATTCLSPAQVGDHAEVVIVMVASDQQVEEVVAQSGLLHHLFRPSIQEPPQRISGRAIDWAIGRFLRVWSEELFNDAGV